MDVSLEQLRTLAAVVDEGTFDAASVALGVTPSAVSQRIKALEVACGRVLLTRSKPVRPTPPGQAMLRLARSSTRLADDTARELGLGTSRSHTRLPIAVNADSMATWFLPALARLPARHAAVFDIHVDDQDRTDELFSSESVLAAVTSVARPVPGCSVTPLGTTRYFACAAVDFAEAHFPDGLTPSALATAPVVVFNRKDSLQHRFLRELTGLDLDPPAHHLPASADFLRGIQLGLGWGLVPVLQWQALRDPSSLSALAPDRPVDVPLYWQVWTLDSPALQALTSVVTSAAARSLTPMPAD